MMIYVSSISCINVLILNKIKLHTIIKSIITYKQNEKTIYYLTIIPN